MKSLQPKDGAPPHDDDPGGQPLPLSHETSSATNHQPQQTEAQPMPDTRRQTRNAEVNFRGEKRSNAPHASVTDPDARLYRKAPGAAAHLCFMGITPTTGGALSIPATPCPSGTARRPACVGPTIHWIVG